MSALLKQPLSAIVPQVDRAQGVFIYDAQGRDYLDGSGGAMTVSIGHGVPEVLAAMQEQAAKVCFTYRTHSPALPPKNLPTCWPRSRPVTSITSSSSTAARKQPNWRCGSRFNTGARRGSPEKPMYWDVRSVSRHDHGLALDVGSCRPRADYGDLLHTFAVAPPPYPYRFPVADWALPTHGAAAWEKPSRNMAPTKSPPSSSSRLSVLPVVH